MLLMSCAKPKKDPHLTFDLRSRSNDSLSFAAAMGQLDVPAIAERCGPSVVVILGQEKQGSGVIIDDGRLVVTNAHVVEGEPALRIRLQSGTTVSGELLAADPKADLALLRMPSGRYAAATLGDGYPLRAGEPVVAIGAPLGLEQTVSSGEVAALRELEGQTVIQISVPVSRGSSGGGLFDRQGRLVGITTASIEKGQNLNFAMPARAVRDLMNRHAATAPSTVQP